MFDQTILDKGYNATFRKNTYLYTCDDETTTLYYIISGSVKLVRLKTHDSSREIVLSMLGPGNTFGETSYVSSCPRTETAITTSDTKVLTFTQKDDALPKDIIITLLSTRLNNTLNQVHLLLAGGVYHRLVQFLTDSQDENGYIKERMTHAMISGFIGSSREMVTLMLKELIQGGYISMDKKYYRILKKLPEEY